MDDRRLKKLEKAIKREPTEESNEKLFDLGVLSDEELKQLEAFYDNELQQTEGCQNLVLKTVKMDSLRKDLQQLIRNVAKRGGVKREWILDD